MKPQLLIIALLLSSYAMAQKPKDITNKPVPDRMVKPSTIFDRGFLSADSISTSVTYAPYTIRAGSLPVNSYIFTGKSAYTLMRISDQKPDSSYHVWIDKKAIIWTSDSTFTLKRKL